MVLSLNDDRLIMEFLSGRYTGEAQGYGIHLKYPLSGLIALLYKLLPDFDWYGYTMLGLMVLCVLLICFRVVRITEGKRNRWIGAAGVFALAAFAIGEQMITMTYSTVAAIMGATILFLYGTSDGRKSDLIVLGLLSLATWCLRYHLFYMILPAAGLIWLYKDVFTKKNALQKVITPLIVLLFVGTGMLINHAMYSADDWQEFEAFNTSRITIYDNPNDYYFPDYETKQAYYEDLGLNQPKRRLLIYYGLLFCRDEIPTDTFHRMVENRKNYGDNESEYLSARLINGTKNFMERTLRGQCGALFYVAVAGFLFVILCLLWKKNLPEAGKILLLFGAQLCIFWAMEMNGRMPERVIYSLSIMLFATMVMAFFWERKELPDARLWKCGGILLCALLFCFGVTKMKRAFEENKEAVAINYEKENVVRYCNDHPENFYYISTGYLCTSGYNFYFGKVDNSQMNYMSTGDWVSYSPLQQARLEQEGWDSAVESLLEGENVYLISREDKYVEYFKDYMSDRCQTTIVPVVTDTIGDINVYRFDSEK